MKVLALAPRMESTLPEFLRPVVKGRIACYAVLLSMYSGPVVKTKVFDFCFNN